MTGGVEFHSDPKQDVREAIALSLVEAGAKMILEAVTSTSIRADAVDYQCRFHIESMVRELRRVIPEYEPGQTKPTGKEVGR